MFYKASRSHHERRSALIAHGLSRLDVDIAALSEVRLAVKGSLRDTGAGFSNFWLGKQSTDSRLGVGCIVRNPTTSKLEISPTCHSNRIISMRLPVESNQHLTLFSVYAPNPMADFTVKNSLYSALRRHFNNTPAIDQVLTLGDFNV